ncbi:hypothetical protein COOONC_08522 [Cooperia oncophora]
MPIACTGVQSSRTSSRRSPILIFRCRQLWDIGGQPRFRSMWERYCRGVNAIVFMVDAADEDKLESFRAKINSPLPPDPSFSMAYHVKSV